jgi:coproporphyrinogen III oxidase
MAILYKTPTRAFRERWIEFIHDLQDQICSTLEKQDGKGQFSLDLWDRTATGGPGGGGGKTRVMAQGQVIEKGGVNTSVVWGPITQEMHAQLKMDGASWFAAGISIVIHPVNPYVPTIHANWRYFEMYDPSGNVQDRWFGGGTDLTPFYLFEEDAMHFHHTLKSSLAHFGSDLYQRYKKECDQYFTNKHRGGEARGIGGVFYDHLRPDEEMDLEKLFLLQQSSANAFLDSYIPIVEKRKNTAFGPREKRWQEIRRGRYVEFNLLHDRGTVFGLKTNGRTQSILMSLPPTLRFEYNDEPEPGSEEERLLQVCINPRDWA